MNASIISIGTAVPRYRIRQSEVAEFMARTLQMNEREKQRLLALYRASGISYRYSVLPDYATDEAADSDKFFPENINLEPFPSISQRMEVYQEKALALSMAAVEDCLSQIHQFDKQLITHLITVSCTGMYAPGLDIELIHQLRLNHQVQRTAINFMGCYAAFNALKVADSIIRSDPEAQVLLVCTELCSIHFQTIKDEDNMLANALFGDGSAAALLSGSYYAGLRLDVENFYCDLVPEGKKDMAWKIGDFGFEMRLSAYVPEIIKSGITRLTANLMSKLAMPADDDFEVPSETGKADFYAIHPGGKRIIQSIEEVLNLEKDQNYFSYQVLKKYGNMSSPTILFVLKAMLANFTALDADKTVLALAFGPGLTLESMLLKIASG